jgi:DNA-binding transcriptional regulator YdaS (Cro superfamily)
MNKQEAIDLLGGSVTAAAEAIGITPSAVSQWPEVLPDRVADRVHAALWRRDNQISAPIVKPEGAAE